jgi:hypothetical protein
MILNLIETKEILDLEKEIGFELEANERPVWSDKCKFYVSFKEGESMEGGALISYSGNGNTVDEALRHFCEKISCRRIAFNSFTPERKEIQMPKLIHTKLLGY